MEAIASPPPKISAGIINPRIVCHFLNDWVQVQYKVIGFIYPNVIALK